MPEEKPHASGDRPSCNCFGQKHELSLHSEVQNTNCDGWAMLTDLIEKAVSLGSQEFVPRHEMAAELWSQIITLPTSISKLTSVRKLHLYGSHIVRVPPEIGDMANLEELDQKILWRNCGFECSVVDAKARTGQGQPRVSQGMARLSIGREPLASQLNERKFYDDDR